MPTDSAMFKITDTMSTLYLGTMAKWSEYIELYVCALEII